MSKQYLDLQNWKAAVARENMTVCDHMCMHTGAHTGTYYAYKPGTQEIGAIWHDHRQHGYVLTEPYNERVLPNVSQATHTYDRLNKISVPIIRLPNVE